MNIEQLPDGVVYTETVVYTAPERYVSEAPYQIGIIELSGSRITARIHAGPSGTRAHIGDSVRFAEWRDGVPYFVLAGNDCTPPR